MGDAAACRTGAMAGVEGHGWPAREGHLAARGHGGWGGWQHEIELDRDIGHELLPRRDRAAQIEFLLDREHEMNGREVAALLRRARHFEQHGTGSAVVDGGATDSPVGKFDGAWCV